MPGKGFVTDLGFIGRVQAALEKVGPKGYIHGWIKVLPGEVGDIVHHPELGRGTVTRRGKRTVGVQFDSGKYHAFDHGAKDRTGAHFVERAPKPRAAPAAAATSLVGAPGKPQS